MAFPDRQRPPVQRLGLDVDMTKQLAIEQDALTASATCQCYFAPGDTNVFTGPTKDGRGIVFRFFKFKLKRLETVVGDHPKTMWQSIRSTP
jgi:hypothetical protein